MSVGTYTGTGSAATIGHGLGVTPEMIIVKNTSTASRNWAVYHIGTDPTAPEDKYLRLNATTAVTDSNTRWNDTAPTSSVFTVGTENVVNESGDTMLFIAFAPSEFISIGSYEGNANADGPYVPCINSAGVPLMPIWTMVKNIDNVKDWVLLDAARSPHNLAAEYLLPNSTSTENPSDAFDADLVTGGFKLRTTGQSSNYQSQIHLTIGIPAIDTDGRLLTAR
tara:strand:+ start:56 stop:724 length:669 start_codon:yes stop_codon:yes gene_type:complete